MVSFFIGWLETQPLCNYKCPVILNRNDAPKVSQNATFRRNKLAFSEQGQGTVPYPKCQFHSYGKQESSKMWGSQRLRNFYGKKTQG